MPEFIGTSGGERSIFRESANSILAVDTTTASAVFVDLLTVAITVEAGFILIESSIGASLSVNAGTIFFRITVDGVAQAGVSNSFTIIGDEHASAFCLRVAVAAGLRTVKLQWRVASVLSTARIRPVTQPDAEHASLVVSEVTA